MILNVKVVNGFLLLDLCFIFLFVFGRVFLIVGIFSGDGR